MGYRAGDNITSGDGNVIIGSVDAASATGDRQLKIAGNDGSTTTTWISGDNSGNLTFGGTITVGSATVTEAQLEILDGATVTTTELNLLDDKDATHLAVPGKFGGTNFATSLLVGHATFRNFNAAEQ